MPDIFNLKKQKSKTKKPAAKPQPNLQNINITEQVEIENPTNTDPQGSPQKIQNENTLSDSAQNPAPSAAADKQTQAASSSQNPLRIFTTFLQNPSGVSFTDQDPSEKIVLFLRRDFGANTSWIVATIVLIFIPPLLGFIFNAINFTVPFLPANFITVFTMFYYLVVVGFAFSNFLTWFYTIGIVTNKRAVDIDFVNVSSINVASADFNDIIDAKYSQNGFSQSFFDYGDIEVVVQTTEDDFVFEKVPKPAEVSNIINNLIENK